MKERINRIQNSLLSRDIPLRARLINICLFLSTIGGVIATIATIIQNPSTIAIIAIMLLPISTIILQVWVGRTGQYRLASFIVAIVLCMVLFPIIFFSSGGINSGMIAYFILGSVIIFLLLSESVWDCAIMTILYLSINTSCIYVSYLRPELVTPIRSAPMVYFDIIVAIIASTFLVEMALAFQNLMYKNEQKLAEEAMNAKDDFLASMSHELRTPLNAIIGLSEIQLKTQDSLPKSTQEDIKRIFDSGTTLLRIINDLLDISKIGSGQFELICAEYNTADMINDSTNINRVRIGNKLIEFQVIIDPSLPVSLYGDELRIRQILNNILSNAFKYTQEGKVQMHMSYYLEGDDAILIVKISDTGIGIHSEDIPFIFSKYKKLDNIKNRHIEGTGLGLAITQELLQRMDGSIEVESVYEEGSTFTIKLPQKIIDPTPIGQSTVDFLTTFTYQDDTHNQQAREYTFLQKHNALVVDDVEINLYITKEMLIPYQLKVDCVESGAEAIKLIKEEKVKYDIIFMDHMMPEIDGMEATRIIREEIDSDYARTVPIVALTANALVGNEEIFLNRGFQEFLSKPVDSQKLDEVLKRLLQ